MPHFLRRIVEEQADIALVLTAGVERVGAIERKAVLRRLHVFEAVRNFRLAGANAEFLILVEIDVCVKISDLAEIAGRRAVRADLVEARIGENGIIEVIHSLSGSVPIRNKGGRVSKGIRRIAGEVLLEIKVEMIGDIAAQDDACAANKEILALAD